MLHVVYDVQYMLHVVYDVQYMLHVAYDVQYMLHVADVIHVSSRCLTAINNHIGHIIYSTSWPVSTPQVTNMPYARPDIADHTPWRTAFCYTNGVWSNTGYWKHLELKPTVVACKFPHPPWCHQRWIIKALMQCQQRANGRYLYMLTNQYTVQKIIDLFECIILIG